MPFSEKEMLEDLHKVRIRKYVYFLGGLGILGLSVALVVLFFARHDWPALLLAAVGAFWSVILVYHAYRTHQLDGLISERLGELRSEPPGDGDEDVSGLIEQPEPAAGPDPGYEGTPEGGAPGEP